MLYFWNNGQWAKFKSVAVTHVLTYYFIRTLHNGTKSSPLSYFPNTKIITATSWPCTTSSFCCGIN